MTVMVTGVDAVHAGQQHRQRTSGQRCSKPFSQVRMCLLESCGQSMTKLWPSYGHDCMSMKMAVVSMIVKGQYWMRIDVLGNEEWRLPAAACGCA